MATYDNNPRVKIISDGQTVTGITGAVTTESKTEEGTVTIAKKPIMTGSIPANSRIVADIVPFKAIGEIMRISNTELCAIINSYFRPIFHDYVGSYIIPDISGMARIELVFEHNPEPINSDLKIANVVDLTNTHVNDLYARARAIQYRSMGKHYTLNPETKLLLSDIMYGGRDGNKATDDKRWKQNLREHPESLNSIHPNLIRPGTEHSYVIVSNVDPKLLVREIFGHTMVISTKNTNNGEVENINAKAYYEVRIAKILPGINNFMLDIIRFDVGGVEQESARENPYPIMAPSLPIVTA